MKPMFKRLYFICVYFFSWSVFGAVCLGLNFFCAFLLLLPGRERREPAVREIIRRLFASWASWLHASRIVLIAWHGPDTVQLPRPAVYVANHPGLLDATILLSRLPDAVCIFKPALRRNPFLAPAAIMAGYLSGENGLDLVRDVAAKVAAGRTLLIFPEGTRTSAGSPLNSLKSGFVLIAQRAGVPIQLLVIKASRDLLPRGFSWWRVPQLPARMEIHVDRTLPADPTRDADDIMAEVQHIFSERLGGAT